MFSMLSGNTITAPTFKYPTIPECSAKEKLKMEKEVAGMYFSGNLLDSYSKHIQTLSAIKTSDLLENEDIIDKQFVKLTGIITSMSIKTTKKNDKMAFISLEDKYGEIECILFPTQFEKYSNLISEDSAIYAEGNISLREDETPKVIINKLSALIENNSYSQKASDSQSKRIDLSGYSKLYIRFENFQCNDFFTAKNIIDKSSGTVKVFFYDLSKKEYHTYTHGIMLSNEIYQQLIDLLGNENVVPK